MSDFFKVPKYELAKLRYRNWLRNVGQAHIDSPFAFPQTQGLGHHATTVFYYFFPYFAVR